MTRRVLLVEDDAAVREALAQTLELADLVPVAAGSFVAAKDFITAQFEGVILSDMRLPGRDGFHLLEYAQSRDRDLPVIFLTGEGDIAMAVRAMSDGAFDFLEKPCAPKTLLAVVDRALKLRKLVLENRALKAAADRGDAAARMVWGKSPVTEVLRARLRHVARTGAHVLVVGEPGTGTANMAEVIHLLHAGAQRNFGKRAAAGLTPLALAAALDEVGNGTLFLDEVSSLPPETQMALRDYLDSSGATRIVAGTYRSLDQEVAAGHFNQDLFLKLDAVRVRIPALKERVEDIPMLFRHYVSVACAQSSLTEPEITQEHLARLMSQNWPGNTRALMNAATRFSLGLSEPEEAGGVEEGLAEQMARVERTLLVDALQRSNGQAAEAARRLQLPRKTFYDKLARHGIRPEAYR